MDKFYELIPVRAYENIKGCLLTKHRLIIGSSESCDIVLQGEGISAIHAVLEIKNGRFRIFDMNSEDGTFVNDRRVISAEFTVGDRIRLAYVEFFFRKYVKDDLLPPVLSMLEVNPKDIPVPPVLDYEENIPLNLKKELPSAPVKKEFSRDNSFEVIYPLAADPKADYCEYIFEDIDTLYSIFKYRPERKSLEVMILFKDRIFSIDYFPLDNRSLFLVGYDPTRRDIELPQLGKNECIEFARIKNSEIHLENLFDFEVLYLSDFSKEQLTSNKKSYWLGPDDIIRLKKNELQIFIRQTEAPPKVKSAPIFRRDNEFKKSLVISFLSVFIFLFAFNKVQFDPELEEDKVPERVAKILYQTPPIPEKKKKEEVIEKKKEEPPKEDFKEVSKNKEKVAEEPKVEKKAQDIPKEETKTPEKPLVEKVAEKEVKPAVEKVERPKQELATSPKPTPKEEPKKNPPAPKNVPLAKTSGTKGNKVPQVSNTTFKSVGHVDTYQSADFSNTINSILTKGGSVKAVNPNLKSGDALGVATVGTMEGGQGGKVELAKGNASLKGLTDGTAKHLEVGTGIVGVGPKKSIYTAGLPTRTVIRGSIDPEIIKQILRDHLPQFHYCYQKQLDRSGQKVEGIVGLNFVIGASGHVVKAAIERGDSFPPDVQSCVLNVLQGLKFPAPMGGGRVEVRQPINFSAKTVYF